MVNFDEDLRELRRLIEVMQVLRAPKGCPWDREQTHETLIPCLLEEAYEVVEAIEKKDMAHLCEELGDVLLQVIFHAQIAQENSAFGLAEIARREADKMIERHPHVFGDRQGIHTPEDVIKNWESDKARKKAENATPKSAPTPVGKEEGDSTPEPAHSVLDGVNTALPALLRAVKLQKRVARVGFDWAKPHDIFEKIREETEELAQEIHKMDESPTPETQKAMDEEFGDLFFVMANLARRLNIDPETALRKANTKFERRFRALESIFAAQNKSLEAASLPDMEAVWQQVKQGERT